MAFKDDPLGNKEAKENEAQAQSYLKTSCIFCKFKPNYLDAIPYLQKAADSYHGSKEWLNEIKCRENLARCFKETNSFWEEGTEYEKIAKIKLNQLSLSNDALISIQNAHSAMFSQREYESSIKCLVSLAQDYLIRGEYNFSERCLKTAYESIQKIFHVIAMNKDTSPITYVYKCIVDYVDILIRNNKDESCADILNNTIKMIKEDDSSNTEQIEKCSVILLGVFIILGEEKNYTDLVDMTDEGNNLRMIQRLKNSIKDKNEKEFKDSLVDAEYVLPGEMCKKLKNIFNKINNQQDILLSNDINIKVDNENNDDDLR